MKIALICSTVVVLPNGDLSHGPSWLRKCSELLQLMDLLPTSSFALPSFVLMTFLGQLSRPLSVHCVQRDLPKTQTPPPKKKQTTKPFPASHRVHDKDKSPTRQPINKQPFRRHRGSEPSQFLLLALLPNAPPSARTSFSVSLPLTWLIPTWDSKGRSRLCTLQNSFLYLAHLAATSNMHSLQWVAYKLGNFIYLGARGQETKVKTSSSHFIVREDALWFTDGTSLLCLHLVSDRSKRNTLGPL